MINSGQLIRYDCEDCQDSGWRVVVGEGATRCQCLTNRIRARALARIPAIYRTHSLASLTADVARHPKQARLIEAMRAKPDGSYLLFGKNGCGKSMLGWVLYRDAIESGRIAVGVMLSDLLAQFRAWERDNDKLPMVTANDLRTDKRRYFVFLDELEKARPSEYAAEMLFQLVDAVYSNGHQLVITSNLRPDQLREHWSVNGEVYGPSILRRILEIEGGAFVDLF